MKQENEQINAPFLTLSSTLAKHTNSRISQILPKSFPARPALTHGLNDIAANLTLRNIKQRNNGLNANTRLLKLGGHVQIDNDNKI